MEPTIQENQSSISPVANQPANIQVPRDSIKDVLVSFFSIAAFYWAGYLFVNYAAIPPWNNSGFSVFPAQSNPWIFVFALIGYFLSIFYVFLVRKLIQSGRRVLSNISLWVPFLLICLIIAWFFTFAIFHLCSDLCLGPGILAMTSIALITGAYISLAIAAISIFLVRNKYALIVIIILLTLLFLVPTIYTFYSLSSTADLKNKLNELSNKNIPIQDVTLQKTEISEQDYNAVDKIACCTVLERRLNGTLVLAKIDKNRLLVQAPMQRDDQLYNRGNLFVEESGRMIDIGGNASFDILTSYLNIGSRTRPIALSISKNMVGFFMNQWGGVFIITKLDGSGIYTDKDLCPFASCTAVWGKDDFIYLFRQQQGNWNESDKLYYYRVTPPEASH